jgi:hypothetical protein
VVEVHVETVVVVFGSVTVFPVDVEAVRPEPVTAVAPTGKAMFIEADVVEWTSCVPDDCVSLVRDGFTSSTCAAEAGSAAEYECGLERLATKSELPGALGRLSIPAMA